LLRSYPVHLLREQRTDLIRVSDDAAIEGLRNLWHPILIKRRYGG